MVEWAYINFLRQYWFQIVYHFPHEHTYQIIGWRLDLEYIAILSKMNLNSTFKGFYNQTYSESTF